METSTSSQGPSKAEDWPRVFEQNLNAADLDAVMTLYEPEAHFATKSGEILVGHDAIRKVLGEMIDAKTDPAQDADRRLERRLRTRARARPQRLRQFRHVLRPRWQQLGAAGTGLLQ